jgi:hypothetical protein
MSFWSWLGSLFHNTTPPPSTPIHKAIGLVVAFNGTPLVGVKAALDGVSAPFPPTDATGYAVMDVPISLTASQLTLTVPTFQTYSVHVDLPMENVQLRVGAPRDLARPQDLILPGLQSLHFDPSGISLRDLAKIRGAMWTVRGPWRFGPRPGSPDNITAMEYIYVYGDPNNASVLTNEQKAMLDTYLAQGYTHVAFGPINAQSYHGQYPDTDFTSPDMFEKWLDWLQMFWDHGLAPICFLHPDGGSFEDTVAMYDHLIRGNPRAQRLMRIVVPTGWEPVKYEWSSTTWAKFCAWARDLLPNALVLIHTVSDVDAPVGTDANGDDNGRPNGEGWSRVTPHIHGWLIQNGAYSVPPSQDPTLAQNFAAQFDQGALGAQLHGAAWHFINGVSGWPQGSAWSPTERIYIYNAECTSYEAYWHNIPYSTSTAWGDLAMKSGADGYLDGGTVPVPGRS